MSGPVFLVGMVLNLYAHTVQCSFSCTYYSTQFSTHGLLHFTHSSVMGAGDQLCSVNQLDSVGAVTTLNKGVGTKGWH